MAGAVGSSSLMGVPTPRESTFSEASSISCCETSLLSWVSWSGPSQLPERVATEAGEEGEAVLELEGAVVELWPESAVNPLRRAISWAQNF